ncbi:MAG: hypothetical protein WCP55_04470 [Lentisphaerota bacterium]
MNRYRKMAVLCLICLFPFVASADSDCHLEVGPLKSAKDKRVAHIAQHRGALEKNKGTKRWFWSCKSQ